MYDIISIIAMTWKLWLPILVFIPVADKLLEEIQIQIDEIKKERRYHDDH